MSLIQDMLTLLVFGLIINFKIFHIAKTQPIISWNYQPTLLQCGIFTIFPAADATVAVYNSIYYNITFNRLVNPTTRYFPAMGYVDLNYIFQYIGGQQFLICYDYIPTATDFTIRFYVSSDPSLIRVSMNYLAVSQDLKYPFIYIEFKKISSGVQINSSNSITQLITLSTPLPINLTNIKTIVSIHYLNLQIREPTTLFDYQIAVSIIDQSTYQIKISSLLARTYVYYANYYIIFYQQNNIPYRQTLEIPVLYSSSTPTNFYSQILHPSDLIDSFQATRANSFFALSRLCSQGTDFTVSYLSNTSMNLAFNKTLVIQGNIFIFRQIICQSPYVISNTQPKCQCANLANSSVSIVGCLFTLNGCACSFCSFMDNFLLDSFGNCICKTGFQLKNETCEEICGDGIKFNYQCDDGNNVSGDGCSSICEVQNDFLCSQKSNGVSLCQIKENICFNVTDIHKNYDNSAIFTFQAIGANLPFDFFIGDFEVTKSLNLTIKKPDQTSYVITYSISQISGKIVKILVDYHQTIEGSKTVINFNFNQSKYLSQDCTLNFDCVGSQLPLVASQYIQQYQIIEKINLFYIVLLNIVFVFGMLAPKWIGVEALQVIQLIFFSQMLITDTSNWPAAFSVFIYFKYSNGFNNVFQSYPSIALSVNSIKWVFLGFQPIFIFNYLINFCLIAVFIVINIIATSIRKQYQNIYLQKKHQGIKLMDKSLIESLKKSSEIERKLYQVLINVMVWSILQNLASISVQFQFKDLFNYLFLTSANTILSTASFFIGVIICGTLFLNIHLNQYTIRKISQKQQLQKYKQVNVVYHVLLGIFIFCLNKFSFKGIHLSVIIFIFELCYIFYLCKLKPYQKSLKVHQIGLIINRVVFLVFLLFVSLKNIVPDISQGIMIVICYFIVGLILILIIFSFIRLYYDLRYGEALEIRLKEQQQQKEKETIQFKIKKQKQEQEQIRRNALKDNQINYKLNNRRKNKYLYQNQVNQQEKIQTLQFLQKNKNMTKQQKQLYYYSKFTEKPLSWLEKHDKKQYQKKVKKMQAQKLAKPKRNQKDQTELEEVQQRLRKQCIEKKIAKNKKICH